MNVDLSRYLVALAWCQLTQHHLNDIDPVNVCCLDADGDYHEEDWESVFAALSDMVGNDPDPDTSEDRLPWLLLAQAYCTRFDWRFVSIGEKGVFAYGDSGIALIKWATVLETLVGS